MQVVLGGNWELFTNTIPKGFEVIGTVTHKNVIGALAVNQVSAKFVQVNANVIKHLNQRAVSVALEISKLNQTFKPLTAPL